MGSMWGAYGEHMGSIWSVQNDQYRTTMDNMAGSIRFDKNNSTTPCVEAATVTENRMVRPGRPLQEGLNKIQVARHSRCTNHSQSIRKEISL